MTTSHPESGPTTVFGSHIALGLAALGRPGYINLGHEGDVRDASVEGMRAQAWDMLDAAYAEGLRHVDTARSYGLAEEFLGGWLIERRHKDVAVTSKWGYTYTADWRTDAAQHEVKSHTLDTYLRQIAETSMALPRLDGYQIHSATLDSGVLEDTEVLSALSDLADTGVTIGLTLSGAGQGDTLRAALALAHSGGAPFRLVQATWNVLEPSVGDALQHASDAGWTVIIKEVLANGRLTDRGDPPALLRNIAAAHGVGVDAAAIAVALVQPFTDVVLSGASTREQLRSNLQARQVRLEPEQTSTYAGMAEDPDEYWSHRSSLPWT